jgi:hypothetical protein
VKGTINVFLRPIIEEIMNIKNTFVDVSFMHVYRERNMTIDYLSKEGLLMAPAY